MSYSTISFRKQRTLSKPVEYSGIGIHHGQQVVMRFCPAPERTGIIFKRTDLPGQPMIPAGVEYVTNTNRSTTIGVGGAFVHTIEHVLAAIKAYQIDNLVIEVSAAEPPVGNGSSDVFVEMIEKAGISEQQDQVPVVAIQKPVVLAKEDMHLVALPYEGFRISYTLHYPHSPLLNCQFHSVEVSSESFKNEIAPCRTFSLYEEVEHLIDKGLIKGGSLSNNVVIKGNAVFSKEGLFFPNEMVRHKILDLIGDISLIGFCLRAHIVGYKTGHAANVELGKEILKLITSEKKHER